MIYLLLSLILLGVAVSTLTLLSQKKELKGGGCGKNCTCKTK